MKLSRFSDLESYKLDFTSFKDGIYFAEDIEDENIYYDKLYALIDDEYKILVMAYLYLEEKTVLMDLLTVNEEVLEKDLYKREFIKKVNEEFGYNRKIKVKDREKNREDWETLGFVSDGKDYLVLNKGE